MYFNHYILLFEPYCIIIIVDLIDCTMNISDVEEHISQKYEIKKRLGKGAYGIVWKAVDRRSGEVVAVKKIFDAFRNRTDAQEFGDHPNIIKLLNVIRAQNDRDIYLVFEYMETDLHVVIKRGTLLKGVHLRYIMYQILNATKFLHSGNVIHRDQKPSNVLLDRDCQVKLCDFGLARSLQQIDEEVGNPALTEYVATRWYRAPEILLGSPRYTKGVDMWSVGCILGEMLLGKALFPGTSTINQVERIMRTVPQPTPEDIRSIHSEYGASVIQRMLQRPQVSLEELLPAEVAPDALDLLKQLLVFNPDKRLSAEQALQHHYVCGFHNPSREPSLAYEVVLPVDDHIQLSVTQYRNKLYEMILEKRSRLRGTQLNQGVGARVGAGDQVKQGEGLGDQVKQGEGLGDQVKQGEGLGDQVKQGEGLGDQNQRPPAREPRPAPKYGRKVFQNSANVGAAGDPRSKLGSYSQAYGTISKTGLENLLRTRGGQ
ncbi:hypothetical protein JZ751_013405 [Albula glossodonta]|uniref:Protein kinase domain-containing protein n=1 Tax=Albula glossodonta TaxID=121402 RepID=A0A8T2N9I4_9TELE|nr:hypothetical protein JZ751_013405 [Albula glossodonta]